MNKVELHFIIKTKTQTLYITTKHLIKPKKKILSGNLNCQIFFASITFVNKVFINILTGRQIHKQTTNPFN